MTLLLSALGLTKGYGPRPLFAELALDLRASERVGLIGPNGSGKSTLLRLLAGREQPDSGTRSLRRGTRLGYVRQDDSFAPGQTARDVVLAALQQVTPESRTDSLEVKEEVRKALKRFFARTLERRPVIVPFVMEM